MYYFCCNLNLNYLFCVNIPFSSNEIHHAFAVWYVKPRPISGTDGLPSAPTLTPNGVCRQRAKKMTASSSELPSRPNSLLIFYSYFYNLYSLNSLIFRLKYILDSFGSLNQKIDDIFLWYPTIHVLQNIQNFFFI